MKDKVTQMLVLYVYHMLSFIIILWVFILVCILVHLLIIGYAMSKLFVLIAMNNSLNLVRDRDSNCIMVSVHVHLWRSTQTMFFDA
jgi:hypothetical protein